MYGLGGHLGNRDKIPRTNFHSPAPCKLHWKFGFSPLSGLEEKVCETLDGRTDDG